MLVPVLLTLAVHLTLGADCPANCDCVESSGLLKYTCSINGGKVSVLAVIHEAFSIECRGFTNFSCADLPRVHINYTIDHMHVYSCAPRVMQCLDGLNITELDFEMLLQGPYKLEDYNWPDPSIVLPWSSTLAKLEILGYALPQTFKGLSHLKALHLTNSKNFSSIKNDTLKGLDSLEKLHIMNAHQLSSIEAGAFNHIPQLRLLTMQTVKNLTNILPGQLNGLKKLKTIYLYRAYLTNLGNRAFADMPSLQDLEVYLCNLKTLPEDTLIGSKALTSVGFIYNHIKSIPVNFFTDQRELKILNLNENNLATLPRGVFKTLEKLETLNLNGNSFDVLPEYIFEDLKSLKELSLDFNYLNQLSDTVFQGVRNLETLSLASNILTLRQDLDGESVPLQYSPFHQLLELKELQLRGNAINNIYKDWRENLTKLEVMNLTSNLFTELMLEDFQFLSQNTTIDLRDNKIETVHLPYASYLYPLNNTNQNTILLEGNPLTCDCRLYPLIMRLQGANGVTSEPKFDVGHTTCYVEPTEDLNSVMNLFPGYYINGMSPKLYNCSLNVSKCPKECSSCKWEAPTNNVRFECATAPKSLVKSSGDVALKLHELKDCSKLDVQILNLTGLGIDNDIIKEFKLPATVKEIDLSNNLISIPPVYMINAKIFLYLAKNPLMCECRYYEQLTALQESRLVLDYDDLTCNDGSKIKLDLLCSIWENPVVAIGTTLLVIVLLMAFSSVLCYIYSNEIIIYLINNGICTRHFEDEDADKEYDVFVSFSHKDFSFVQDELMPKLEEEFKLKTCIHYRDWNIGEFITAQITRSVESSRKTVIVLSKHFLDSMWATVEFNAAHTLALRESKARVILILLEDVSKEPRLPEEIRAYISTNTYLMKGDAKFWERLRRALPGRKKKFVWRNTKQDVVENPELGMELVTM